MKKKPGSQLLRLVSREDGAVFIVAALMMTVLLGFSALVIDMGSLYLEKSSLQNALDAAALAGAQSLPATADATAKAQLYFADNGYSSADLIVSFPDSSTITCSSSQSVETTFARVLGINSTNTQELHATAIKTKRNVASPFDYAVFQGEPGELLTMGGAAFTVKGKVFSNGAFCSKPGGATSITALETVSDAAADILPCVSIGSVTTGVSSQAMMDMQWYFDGLKEEATDGRTFTTASSTTVRTWEKNWETLTLDGYNIIDGDFKTSGLVVVNGVLIVNGDYDAAGLMVATGSTLIVNGDLSWGGYGTYLPRFQDATVYVTGSIDARPGGYGTTFTGSNAIYAGQNMFLGGSGIYTLSDETFFYCQNGTLTVSANCNSIYLRGILYSCNGTVCLQSKPNIYGAVIGRHIDSFPGGLTIEYPSAGLGFTQTEDAFRLVD